MRQFVKLQVQVAMRKCPQGNVQGNVNVHFGQPSQSITVRTSQDAAACLRSHASRSVVYSTCCTLPGSSTHVNCQLDPLITSRCSRRMALQLNRHNAEAAAAASRPGTCSFTGVSVSSKNVQCLCGCTTRILCYVYLRQGAYAMPGVCLSVCLLASLRKSY